MWAKKTNFLILSTLYFLSLIFLYFFDFWEYWWLLLLVPIVYSILFVFIINRIYDDVNIIQKLVFSAVLILAGFLFLAFFPTLSVYAQVLFSIFQAVLLYFYLLSLNIYIISEKQVKALPLLQPARLIVFVVLILDVFFGSTIIYKLPFLYEYPIADLGAKFIAFLALFLILFISGEWFHKDDKIGELTSHELLSIRRFSYATAIILAQTALVLSFFPFEAFGKATFLAAVTYVLTNTVHAYLYHRVSFRYFLESLAILVMSYVLVYFL